jgi:hypothetical protein
VLSTVAGSSGAARCITSPFSRNAARVAPRATKETSQPTDSSALAIQPPIAPAPMMQTLFKLGVASTSVMTQS